MGGAPHVTTSYGTWGGTVVTFRREKKVPPLQTQRHNSSNNYTKMERRNDGNFLIARQISDALRTKISRGLITPWRSSVPF